MQKLGKRLDGDSPINFFTCGNPVGKPSAHRISGQAGRVNKLFPPSPATFMANSMTPLERSGRGGEEGAVGREALTSKLLDVAPEMGTVDTHDCKI